MSPAPTDNPLLPLLERYGDHRGGEGIILFVWEQFLADMPDDPELGPVVFDKWQLDTLWEFGEGTRQISIAACHGPGKTAIAAWCIIYSLLFRYPLRAVATAPSRGQIEGALMSEVSKWHEKLPAGLQELIDIKSTSATLKRAPKRAYFEARTARPENPEALQGIHEDEGYVLLIVDEASGVHERIYESAIGSMSGHNCQTILLSNPTRTSGFFFDTHNRNRDRWFAVRVSHEDSKRVTDQFVEEVASSYGRDSNIFRVRALGQFPRSDLDSLIPFDLADAARNRDIVVPRNAQEVWGVDVARFGDDSTVLVRRTKLHVDPNIQVWNQHDIMATANRIHNLYKEAVEKDSAPSVVLVDVIGMGAGVVDRLAELGVPVRGINVSEKSLYSEQYRNLRTELGFLAKEWLEKRSNSLPQCPGLGTPMCPDRRTCVHERLIAEMTTIKYDLTSTGKLLMESKSDMKKRGHKSPDLADAFFLTFAEEPAALVHGTNDGWGYAWNEPLTRNRPMV